MRCYFFGDIHGNRDALEQCLNHADRQKADEIYCLGDLVGWLPFGDRTLNRMRSLGLPTVAGNHDLLVAGVFTDHPDQTDRMQASAYNAGLLSTIAGSEEYLMSLPLILEKDSFTVVHHSPFHLPSPGEPPTIECFNYLDEPALEGCLEVWAAYPKRLILSGHDHLPAVYELPYTEEAPQLRDVIIHRPPSDSSLTLALKPDSRYWVKAGSVGGPYRDGVPTANSVLYDSSTETLTLFRIPYPTDRLRRELADHRFYHNIGTIQRYLEILRE